MLIKIATQESGMRGNAIGLNKDSNGNVWSRDIGWMQINDYYHPDIVKSGCAIDLECSINWSIAKLRSIDNQPCPFWSSQCALDYKTLAQ